MISYHDIISWQTIFYIIFYVLLYFVCACYAFMHKKTEFTITPTISYQFQTFRYSF